MTARNISVEAVELFYVSCLLRFVSTSLSCTVSGAYLFNIAFRCHNVRNNKSYWKLNSLRFFSSNCFHEFIFVIVYRVIRDRMHGWLMDFISNKILTRKNANKHVASPSILNVWLLITEDVWTYFRQMWPELSYPSSLSTLQWVTVWSNQIILLFQFWRMHCLWFFTVMFSWMPELAEVKYWCCSLITSLLGGSTTLVLDFWSASQK